MDYGLYKSFSFVIYTEKFRLLAGISVRFNKA